MSWKRKITAWGNSLAVRLPSQLFRKTNFKAGDEIILEIIDDETIRLCKAGEE